MMSGSARASRAVCCALAVNVVVFLTSCHRPETDVDIGNRLQILHKGNGQEVQDLDPQIVNSVSSLNIISALLEGLVAEDPHDLHPVPGVAESWEVSADEKVYTFHLRHNAKWSNGEPVVAQNFVDAYRRILSPPLASPVAYMLYPVANAEAFNKGKIDNFDQVGFRILDNWTLQITLTNPTPYFLSLLNHYSWFPVPISTIQKYGPVLERGSRWTKLGRYVGNGPFTLEEWRLNDRVRVNRSATYWDAQNVRLHEIVFHTIEYGWLHLPIIDSVRRRPCAEDARAGGLSRWAWSATDRDSVQHLREPQTDRRSGPANVAPEFERGRHTRESRRKGLFRFAPTDELSSYPIDLDR